MTHSRRGLAAALVSALVLSFALAGCGTTSSQGTTPNSAPPTQASTTPTDPSTPPNQVPSQQIIVEPQADEAPYLSIIDHAQKTIDVEAYLVTNTDFVRALKAAAARGVKVKVIVAGDPYRDSSAVAQERSEFASSGISFELAPKRFEGGWVYDHAKFLVADAGTNTGTGILGSSNIDYSGLGGGNREFDVLTSDPSTVSALAAVFYADWTGGHAPAFTRQVLVLSPGAEPTIVSLINSAKTSVDIETEEFGYVAGVMQALQDALKRHVKVQIVVPSNMSNYDMQNLDALSRSGAQVVRLSSPYPHAKLIVVDSQTAFVGSQNFSSTSLNKNREVGIELHGSVVELLQRQFSADFASGRG